MTNTYNHQPLNFLVVEDEALMRMGLIHQLQKRGSCFEASNALHALRVAQKEKIDIAFVDLNLEEPLAGLKLVKVFSKLGIYTVVLSGHEGEEEIRLAYQEGCKDYLVKPLKAEALERILSKLSFVNEKKILEDFFSKRYLTQDAKTKATLEILEDILISDRPVLIQGETGTGKTLIARLIHELRFKNTENFVALNCAEIPENLLESELFGHEKGSFTGAHAAKKGKLLLANEGTLFLDEIATLPLNLQKKLLKALEEKKFYPVGAEKMVESNFKLISATCEDLKTLITQGEFREDLYFRIEGFNIELSPLRERTGDIPFLLEHFLKELNTYGRKVILDNEVKSLLQSYSWPGNIRELQKTVQLFLANSKGIVTVEMLPDKLRACSEPSSFSSKEVLPENLIQTHGLKSYIEKIEEDVLLHFLKKNEDHVRQTLKELKLSNSSYYRILERLQQKGLYRGK